MRWSTRSPDAVVVGAGIHGSAAAWQLARRGASVLHLEQYAPGHTAGSSHGHSRMIRRAYPSEVWDSFLDRAYAAWADLERAGGVSLRSIVGGLFARPVGASGGLRGPGCVPVDPAAVFPGLVLGEGFTAVHDPAAGLIDAPAALWTLRTLGRASGVEQRSGCQVRGWEAAGDSVSVHTSEGALSAGRLVICAGPWTGDLVPGLAPELRVVRIVNVHVGSSQPDLVTPPALGPFAVEVPGVGLVYGLPAFQGQAVKVGLDPERQRAPMDDPHQTPAPATTAEREQLHALARRFLPAADGPVTEALACRYTMAPGNRFLIGALPGHPQVLVAAACSGHGFKFGPAIGEALADLATGLARPDLQVFSPEADLPSFPERGQVLTPLRPLSPKEGGTEGTGGDARARRHRVNPADPG